MLASAELLLKLQRRRERNGERQILKDIDNAPAEPKTKDFTVEFKVQHRRTCFEGTENQAVHNAAKPGKLNLAKWELQPQEQCEVASGRRWRPPNSARSCASDDHPRVASARAAEVCESQQVALEASSQMFHAVLETPPLASCDMQVEQIAAEQMEHASIEDPHSRQTSECEECDSECAVGDSGDRAETGPPLSVASTKYAEFKSQQTSMPVCTAAADEIAGEPSESLAGWRTSGVCEHLSAEVEVAGKDDLSESTCSPVSMSQQPMMLNALDTERTDLPEQMSSPTASSEATAKSSSPRASGQSSPTGSEAKSDADSAFPDDIVTESAAASTTVCEQEQQVLPREQDACVVAEEQPTTANELENDDVVNAAVHVSSCSGQPSPRSNEPPSLFPVDRQAATQSQNSPRQSESASPQSSSMISEQSSPASAATVTSYRASAAETPQTPEDDAGAESVVAGSEAEEVELECTSSYDVAAKEFGDLRIERATRLQLRAPTSFVDTDLPESTSMCALHTCGSGGTRTPATIFQDETPKHHSSLDQHLEQPDSQGANVHDSSLSAALSPCSTVSGRCAPENMSSGTVAPSRPARAPVEFSLITPTNSTQDSEHSEQGQQKFSPEDSRPQSEQDSTPSPSQTSCSSLHLRDISLGDPRCGAIQQRQRFRPPSVINPDRGQCHQVPASPSTASLAGSACGSNAVPGLSLGSQGALSAFARRRGWPGRRLGDGSNVSASPRRMSGCSSTCPPQRPSSQERISDFADARQATSHVSLASPRSAPSSARGCRSSSRHLGRPPRAADALAEQARACMHHRLSSTSIPTSPRSSQMAQQADVRSAFPEEIVEPLEYVLLEYAGEIPDELLEKLRANLEIHESFVHQLWQRNKKLRLLVEEASVSDSGWSEELDERRRDLLARSAANSILLAQEANRRIAAEAHEAAMQAKLARTVRRNEARISSTATRHERVEEESRKKRQGGIMDRARTRRDLESTNSELACAEAKVSQLEEAIRSEGGKFRNKEEERKAISQEVEALRCEARSHVVRAGRHARVEQRIEELRAEVEAVTAKLSSTSARGA